MRPLGLVLALLAAFPLAAQQDNDYGVHFYWESGTVRKPLGARVENYIEVLAPYGATAEFVVELDIPGTDVEVNNDKCSGTKPVRCTFTGRAGIPFSMLLNETGTHTVDVRVLAPPDPNPANDRATWTIEVIDAPSLSVTTDAWRHEPGATAPLYVYLYNVGRPATDVVLTLQLPDGGAFTGAELAGGTCEPAGATMICTLPSLITSATIRASIALPDRLDGHVVPILASVKSAQGVDVDPSDDSATDKIELVRHLLVTNTNDEGGGSLRQALLDADALCATKLCTIDFRIPGDAPAVIKPLSELPEVRGLVNIDGATQTHFAGDTNPAGPEVILDGTLAEGNARGLLLGGPSCEMYVSDLTVQNFPGPGIEARRGAYEFNKCEYFMFPNTSIVRNHVRGNYRGLTFVGPGYAVADDNVVDANRRAGVFAEGVWRVVLRRNRITNNGASGVFLHPDSPYDYLGASVTDNVISGNAEWGVARVAGSDAEIRRNSIFGNRYLAIDAGLDLETPNVASDKFAADGVPNKPVLLSAHYDAAFDKTRVRGRIDSEDSVGFANLTIDFYASASLSTAGFAEAERWLAALQVPHEGRHGFFEVELDGDLRGQFISATNTRVHLVGWDEFVPDTSEISSALRVE